jgi:hypothetical protein
MKKNFFDLENNFYKLVPFSRIEKFVIQLELFKKSLIAKGDIIEFGVYKGNSLIRLISFNKIFNQKKKVFAFDVFHKFPHSSIKKDELHRKRFIKEAGENSISKQKLNQILKKKNFKNVSLIKGNVLKTIPIFLKKNKNLNYSFINLDLDLYEPSLLVLEKFYPKLSKNGIIMLDNFNEFFGETKAVKEFCSRKKIKIRNLTLGDKILFYIKK